MTVTKAAACGSRIEAVLNMQPSLRAETDKTGDEKAAGIENTGDSGAFIAFEDVTAIYNDGADAALENVTFCVARGERIGVIDGTGSGKTTLVNLIPRFYDVSSGAVKIDGKNVKYGDLTRLRERIGVVPQKALLFKGTVRENLLWGRADATDEELYAALKIAQAEEFIREKGGLDATVEQGGKNFSGGQKQRLTIARALVRKPEILILDDSASALDYATEAELRAELDKLETTVFTVSQRASSVKNADKIVVLDEGKVVGLGKHGELFESCEVYREICLSQMQTEGKAV